MSSLAEESELAVVAESDVSRGRVLVAGLVVAAGTMLVAEMLTVLALGIPELLLIGAPLSVGFLLTAGALVAWAVGRVTRDLGLRAASLVFFVAGLVAGGLWGYPVFLLALTTTADVTGEPGVGAGALAGAVYFAATAGAGALAGRYFGPRAATRPALVRTVAACVLLASVIGVAILSFVDLRALT